MCRASFSPFTTSDDITRLTTAIRWVSMNATKLEELYSHQDGVFTHKTFRPQDVFTIAGAYAATSG